MDRLKKLWNCYKEKSLDRLGNSISSSSSTASANNNVYDVKVADGVNVTNCVLFFFLLLLSFLLPPHDKPPSHVDLRREELNSLHVNVEFLTNRINNAAASVPIPAETHNYETITNNDLIDTTPDPIISSTHSSPQNSNSNVTYANLSQPEHTVVDDSANYAISVNDTPSQPLTSGGSIKYVNDPIEEPVYYSEPQTYSEQPAYYEQPGNAAPPSQEPFTIR